MVRGRYLGFVAALVVFLVGLWLQITAYSRIAAGADEDMATETFRTGRSQLANRIGASLNGVQLDVLELTAWVLLALTVLVLFRKAFAAVLAVGIALPYAIFGAVNEINTLRQAPSTTALHDWALFCRQAGGPVIVAGAIATGITFALARHTFSPERDTRRPGTP
ncbi:hypothetical protein [Kutzneria sp. 744]|uniref:hypothetical protein n=1 Tax=Kutzneria sp. (strain 744) TaxID=345341 RepID=UPI0018DBABD0|nr:hypothetical protein [Kutzneria sp. 744]